MRSKRIGSPFLEPRRGDLHLDSRRDRKKKKTGEGKLGKHAFGLSCEVHDVSGGAAPKGELIAGAKNKRGLKKVW